jgi:hypothetical protein
MHLHAPRTQPHSASTSAASAAFVAPARTGSASAAAHPTPWQNSRGAPSALNHPPATQTQASAASGASTVVPRLAGLSLNVQPARGGEFDRPFEWTEELHRANMAHFKNPSFRGCQEQVPLLFALVHCLHVAGA